MAVIDTYLHAIITRAEHEAREDGSTTIEAQHLLLAIAGEPEPAIRQVLDQAGLDRLAIRDALEREFEHSLSMVGVRTAYDLPPPSRLPTHPTMGTSAKLALERGFATAATSRKKDLRPAHLLLGILSARVGTVPRALALAGVDQDALTTRVRRTLAEESA
ncbi:Clp protease N-terminal domain-containing protein [Microbispora triticiradicis]|uniref:Clp protease N-terminal domain-containing protein n=1 Tax=Microbispora triticiradicis TaxID=2200763 RepID=UPI001AD61478|nr:Clp protease N-terminal domain-containing protein [Microbispora triticiradicis]MBO4271493.1 Clp protease [Microbispora triticiradicis]